MLRNISLLIFILILIFSAFFYGGCKSSLPIIELRKDYDFSERNTITVYVTSPDDEELENTYSRVMSYDFQSRGYKVIDANKELKRNSDKIIWAGNRQTADILLKKSYLPVSDIIVIVRARCDSVLFATKINDNANILKAGQVYAGYYVKEISSEISFYDRLSREPVMSISAADTTRLIHEKAGKKFDYPEHLWMIIARQLESSLSRIGLCKNDNAAIPTSRLNVVLWVDRSYRDAFPDTWVERLSRRFTNANYILRNEAGIELNISETIAWDSEFHSSLEETLDKLDARPDIKKNTINIGITLNKDLKINWSDRSTLGLASTFKNVAVITAQPSLPGLQYWNMLEEAATIVHETGHLLGAIHVMDQNSLMYPYSGSLSCEFDDLNLKIINKMKNCLLQNNKTEILSDYSDKLTEIKKISSPNMVPILEPISSAFMNLYSTSHYFFSTKDKLYDFISKIIPDSVYSLAVAGHIQYQRKYYHEARDFFNKAVEIDPYFAEAQWYLGAILKKLGDSSEAELHQSIARPFVKYWVIDNY